MPQYIPGYNPQLMHNIIDAKRREDEYKQGRAQRQTDAINSVTATVNQFYKDKEASLEKKKLQLEHDKAAEMALGESTMRQAAHAADIAGKLSFSQGIPAGQPNFEAAMGQGPGGIPDMATIANLVRPQAPAGYGITPKVMRDAGYEPYVKANDSKNKIIGPEDTGTVIDMLKSSGIPEEEAIKRAPLYQNQDWATFYKSLAIKPPVAGDRISANMRQATLSQYEDQKDIQTAIASRTQDNMKNTDFNKVVSDIVKQKAAETKDAKSVFSMSNDEISAAKDSVLAGLSAPSQYGRSAPRVLAAIIKEQPGFDAQTAEQDYQFGKSRQTQSSIRQIESIVHPQGDQPPLLDGLKALHAKLNTAQIKQYNKLKLAGLSEFNDPDLTAYDNMRNSLIIEIGSALSNGGVPTDQRIQLESQNFKSSFSPEAMAAAVLVSKHVLESRLATFKQKNYVPPAGQKPGTKPIQPPAPTSAQPTGKPVRKISF